MATLALQPATLYNVEEHLAAMVDTQELVPADMEQAFVADLQQALSTAKDKRDRVAQFLSHLESQVEFADREIKRLQERKQWYERCLEKMEGYVIRVIRNLYEPDAKGKYPKLEGQVSSLSLRAKPAIVAFTDESQVPAQYKTVTLKLPAALWNEVLDSLDMELSGKVLDETRRAETTTSKTLVKAALEAEISVPGAFLDGATIENRRYSLVRK